MNIALWIVQILLAIEFMITGTTKVQGFLIAASHSHITAHNELFLFIGACEMAGSSGLILPLLTGILPFLTEWAAAGLATIMALAAGFHISRGEYSHLPLVMGLFVLATFVVWGRGFRKVSTPRRLKYFSA